MSDRDDVLRRAMTLDAEDRIFVADAIERSLGGLEDPQIAEAWATEVDRRIAAYDRGEIPASDAVTTMRRLREQLAERRAGGK